MVELYLSQFKSIFTSVEFIIYLWIVVADVITGNIKGFIKKDWHSGSGINGLLKHFSVTTFVVLVLSSITIYHQNETYQSMVLLFLIGVNVISVVENLSEIGVKLPNEFTKYFRNMKKGDKND